MNRAGSRGSGAPPAPPHAPEAPDAEGGETPPEAADAGGRSAAKPSPGSAAGRSARPSPRGRRAEPAPPGPTGPPGVEPGEAPDEAGARGDAIEAERRSGDAGGRSGPSRQAQLYGPRPLGALLPAITRPAFKKRSPSAAQIMADWMEIAGPALSAVTRPRRVAAGTLTLSCSGPIAMELQHMQAELLARINGHLGRVVVDRLRFVQDAPPGPTPPRGDPSRGDGGEAGRARRGMSAARPHGQAPPPVRVPGVPPGPLHDALAALGRAVARGAARDDP